MKKVLVGAVLIFLAGAVISNAINSQKDMGRKTTDPNAPTPAVTNSLSIKGGSFEVTTDEAAYYGNTVGFFAKPQTQGEYPGVIMIHEWWGLNDNMKVMAQKLASEGYNVLAVDLYEGQVATAPEEARKLTGSIDKETAVENLQAASSFLKEQGSDKVASLGWCFGGGQSLALSLSGEPLDATVIYYGNLESDPQRLRAIRWPVLGIFGDKDASIPVESVTAFEDSLNQLGVENEIYIYPNVGHAFANPTGDNYAPNETEDAWNKTVQFLNRTLKTQAT